MSSLNKEIQLLKDCSRTELNFPQKERVSGAISRELNWDFVFEIAQRNGILPLLSFNLLQEFSDSIPVAIKDKLNSFMQGHMHKNLVVTQTLISIVKMLEVAGIPSLPFKGTTLAMRAYGNLALRDYIDLDILVQPRHFDKAVQILSDNEFVPISTTSKLKRKVLFFTRKKDVVLLGLRKNVQIELHWKLSGSHFAMPYEINELWNRLEKIDIGGTGLNALPFADLFVYLCLHGSRHSWKKFSWICDLHELILAQDNSGKEIDWREIHRHAKAHGCEKVLLLGIFLVEEFFDFRTNEPAFAHIEADQLFRTIAERVNKKVFSETGNVSDIGEQYSFHLALKERMPDRLKLHIVYLLWYLKVIFVPNALDKSVFHLPAGLYPLYFVLRPIRLMISYLNREFLKNHLV